jgi:EAL domain-containing protein (putative c-di-GMP-specific phosphodiesterase class I)
MNALQHSRRQGYPAHRPMPRRKLRREIRTEPAADLTGLQVWYQPLYNLRTLAQTGTEALIRRQDPGRGLQLPSQFLPEGDAGAMIELDLFVLKTVLDEAKTLLCDGSGGDLTFHVNLRPAHLENEAFVSRALDLLDEYRVPPPWLVFEITENQPLDLDRAVPHMEALRRRGCQFALDDFGSGFSNLHYLARLPVRWLKLDRSLITDLPDNPRARTIARQVLGLSRALDSRVIAEGIETPEQRLVLLEMGCEFGQGFLLGRPEPREPAARTCEHDPSALQALVV